MSNAAVINATSTSGQTVGAPISIETGGDVVLKAYGTGEGNWFVVMAFAPVTNGVTGAPVTLTINYNQPGRQTSAVGTSASEWVGWVLDQGGTWRASGIVEGYQPGEALSDDLGTFASVNALPKYGVKIGARASVLGVQYTYRAGGWVIDGLTPYADYGTLSAQAPTVGKIAQIPRLCGNGYFALRGNGTRWEVCPGESIVRDAGVGSAGYDLTATGTAYVALASYAIPAGLIGDGEEWEVDEYVISLDVHASGTDTPHAYLGAASIRGSIPVLTAINQASRMRGAFVRLGGSLMLRSASSSADLYSGSSITDTFIDMNSAQTLTAGFTPGAATNKMRLRHLCFRRIG